MKRYVVPKEAESVQPLERLMTFVEVGKHLGKSAEAVRKMVLRGQLKAVRVGVKGLRVKESDYRAFIASLEAV